MVRWRNDRSELSKEFGSELVGTAARDPQRFPLLLKFLFPEEKLSVQVHPDDATAQRFGEPWGKTECWYVAHAKPGAQIALGLQPGITPPSSSKPSMTSARKSCSTGSMFIRAR